MASLLPCKTCSHECSTEAKQCPNCGQPWPAGEHFTIWQITRDLLRFIVLSILALAVLGFVAFAFLEAFVNYDKITK